jgi:hypothetical protein
MRLAVRLLPREKSVRNGLAAGESWIRTFGSAREWFRFPGAARFRWTVAVLGQLDPVAEGRAKDRAEARLLAKTAVAGQFADWAERSGDESARDG